MMAPALTWQKTAVCGRARAGELRLARGVIATPVFMPVGTLGAVRGAIEARDIAQLGFDILLANTFHLWQRPGLEALAAHGGLHGFNNWRRPILTDSGGFQVFSLAALRKTTEEGVAFRAPHNGAACFLSPENCMDIQRAIGSDIVMALDDCTPADVSHADAAASMRRSMRWAARCKKAFAPNANALFGIMQGGVFGDLRRDSARALCDIGFDGYAIGGLAVGEPATARRAVLAEIDGELPADRPRYLMGVGTPADIALAVADGVDMFDCVMPTRNARNGQLFTRAGILRAKNARHRGSAAPPDAACPCPLCRRYSLGYLHHLFSIGDMLAARLATLHNLAYYRTLMRDLRQGIVCGTLDDVVRGVVQVYEGG